MAEENRTYLAQRGVELVINEAVVGQVVEIFHELHLEAGGNPQDCSEGMSVLVDAINDEMSHDIDLEEIQIAIEKEEKMDQEVDDTVVMGDIEALVSSIQSRDAFQDHIDFVNQAEEEENAGLQGVELVPNQDCRSKTSAATASASAAENEESSGLLNDQQLQQYVQDLKPVNTVRRTRQVCI